MQPTKYELVINLKAAKSASTFHHLCCRVDRIGLFAAVHESGIGTSAVTISKATGERPRPYLPTVTPAVERKASLRLVAFMSSSTSRVRTVVWPGMLRIGSAACGEERRLAL
jgi:hypothetical protein